MTGSISLSVLRWKAWSSGLESSDVWGEWSRAPVWPDALEGAAAPSVRFLPARYRRRLSDLSKMVLYVAHHCVEEAKVAIREAGQELDFASLPMIFASRHGELHRTVEILQSIIAQEPVSPAHFSHSVHNTSAGLRSIAYQDKAPTVALAACEDTFLTGLVEAAGRLHFAPEMPILLVMADQPVPAIYQSFEPAPAAAYAVAFLLTARPIEGCGAWIDGRYLSVPTDHSTKFAALPQALAFLRWLLSGEREPLWLRGQRGQGWCWSRYERED